MNTTAKGDAFEKQVYDAILKEINSERLGVLPHSCQLYRKKAYYSEARKSNIIVDLSIEVTLASANKLSFLWIWECKDLAKPIPVDDVEEFHAKLEQIGSDNIKGGIAVTGGLQKSALSYANSKGIAVVRIMPSGQIRWVIYNILSMPLDNKLDSNEFMQGLTNPNHISTNTVFYGLSDGYIFGDWGSLIRNGVKASVPSDDA
jgi:hypothetical protein